MLERMITEKDILNIFADEEQEHVTVADLMERSIRSLQADDALEDLCGCLPSNHFRRVPILEGKKLVGLVSRSDLMETALEILEDKA